MHAQDTSTLVERRTSGSEQRPPRDLSVALRGVTISQVAQGLQAEPAFMNDGRNAQTVHDDGVVRAMVNVVAGGRDIGAEKSDGYVTLVVHAGRGTLRRGSEALELSEGMLVIVAPGEPWSFEATVSAVLVGIFWEHGKEASIPSAAETTLQTG